MTLADLEKLAAKLRKSPKDANLQLEIGARQRAPAARAGPGVGEWRGEKTSDCCIDVQAARRASRPGEACRAADAPAPSPLTCLSHRVQ